MLELNATNYRTQVLSDLADIRSDTWNGLVDADGGANVFVRHAYLHALHATTCASSRTGWAPAYLTLWDGATLAAATPLYAKDHSYGEYVFDWSWAEAYQRAGLEYYPKWLSAVPFTPVSGRRLLARDAAARRALAEALVGLARASRLPSLHVLLAPREDITLLESCGMLARRTVQFHWLNAGYATFDDFLGALAARKRKVLKRERRDALANGITVDWLTGADLTETAWDTFFAFYIDTGSRKWGRPYLTREFFSLVGAKMADRIVLVMAKRAGRYMAGAINFIGSDTLFGRHWGAIEHHPFLHFELCYYQAIDFAIARKLARVEAGAQGEHKLARGYVPTTTFSAHYIVDPGLRRAIEDFLKRERAYVAAAGEELAEAAPFRKG